MNSKIYGEKHTKYIEFYAALQKDPTKDTEYWGIGIENESYLMFKNLIKIPRHVYLMNQRPERYSVDYWKNYKKQPLFSTLQKLPSHIETPIYINGYLFQNSDIHGNHKTLYTSPPRVNPQYLGVTVDTYLKNVSPVIRDLFKTNIIYDGDTIEFTTFNFYKTNVLTAIKELSDIKTRFLEEVNLHLYGKGLFQNELIYPPFNYGFAEHLSNPDNIAMCNNGTYHINITLPTILDVDGSIRNLKEFRDAHANAIRGIQWVEPLLVALYGSPDILHTLNTTYSGGSQRLSLSRYIGLGTYDTIAMEKGKLLDCNDPKKSTGYLKELHCNSPYLPPEKTGYDFNYNKFTKHGIELRILDSFPEEFLEDVMNFLVLICDYSTKYDIPDPRLDSAWNKAVLDCLRYGSDAVIMPTFYTVIYDIFGMMTCWSWMSVLFLVPSDTHKTPMKVMKEISEHLYRYNRNGNVSRKLSPTMKLPIFVDYNKEIKGFHTKLISTSI